LGLGFGVLLLSVLPLEVVTCTVPVVAPAGTVARISLADTAVKVAGAALNVTSDAPVRLFPRIITCAPAPPPMGESWMKGPSPIDRL